MPITKGDIHPYHYKRSLDLLMQKIKREAEPNAIQMARCSHCKATANDEMSPITHKPGCTNIQPRKRK